MSNNDDLVIASLWGLIVLLWIFAVGIMVGITTQGL